MFQGSILNKWCSVKSMTKIFLFLFLLFFGTRLYSATYYVSTTGNDSAAGSAGAPWLTIQKAANTVTAGDVVNIAAGIYPANPTISASGNASAPIIFNGPGNISGYLTVNGAYVIVTNLTFSWMTTGNDQCDLNGNFDVATGCTFTGTNTTHDNVVDQIKLNGNYCMVTNCNFPSICKDSVGIVAGAQTGAVIANNIMHDLTDADAFIFVWGANVVIKGNIYTNVLNWDINVHMDFIQTFPYSTTATLTNLVVDGNTIINSDGDAFFLMCNDHASTYSPYMGGAVIRNNLIVNVVEASFVGIPNVGIYNNTFLNSGYGSGNSFLYVFGYVPTQYNGSGGDGSHCYIKNNIFHVNSPNMSNLNKIVYQQGGSGTLVDLQYDYDCADSTTMLEGEVHGITSALPGFVNEGTQTTVTIAAMTNQFGSSPTFYTNVVRYYRAGANFNLVSNAVVRSAGTNLSSLFTDDFAGNSRTNSGAWDIGAYAYGTSGSSTNKGSGGGGSTNTLPTISAIMANATGVTLGQSGLQIQGGSVVSLSATATNALTYQWSYATNGGSQVVYQSGSGTVPSASYTYGTNTIGNTYVWTLIVSNNVGSAQSQFTLTIVAAPVDAYGLTFAAQSGALANSFVVGSTVSGTVTNYYVYQPVQTTGVTNGGSATYQFTITNAGNYEVQALVNAPDTSANSFYVNIDSQPQDPNMIWDITTTSGFESRLVGWRGINVDGTDQYSYVIFSLSAGPHWVVFVGREANTLLSSISILPVPQTPPPPKLPGQ